jgi:hypothetical protein
VNQQKSFALVLAIFLVTLLVTTGAGLAITATAESVTAAYVARDLDHRLAVESFLIFLPRLLDAQQHPAQPAGGKRDKRHLELMFGNCHVRCEVAYEKGKLNLATASQETLPRLRALARSHGLSEADIKLRPVVQTNETPKLPTFVWFDQIVQATNFEEIFHRAIPGPTDQRPAERMTWSDLISFWDVGDSTVLALEVQTTMGIDIRQWYVVVLVDAENVKVLWQGMV